MRSSHIIPAGSPAEKSVHPTHEFEPGAVSQRVITEVGVLTKSCW
ncbi:MAG: hypothetical protein AB1938_29910 [Myxococcota bacterium]